MINVGADCFFASEITAKNNADAVKERTPKREILPEGFLSGCKGNTFATVAEAIPRCAIEYLFSVFREIAIFDSIAIFCYKKSKNF